MGKKMKLNLEDLKVQSFVTSLSDEEQNNLKAGRTGVVCWGFDILSARTGILPWGWPCICFEIAPDGSEPARCQITKSQLAGGCDGEDPLNVITKSQLAAGGC